MAAYRVLVGLDYAGKRVEEGAIVEDIPTKSVAWLVEQGLVEKADAAKPSKPSTNREPESPEEEA